MLVQLKRDWFAPGGVFYQVRNGLAEISPDMQPFLPSDAVVVSEAGTMPDRDSAAVPGFGAKPAHEQALDKVPGGAPTHLIEAAQPRSSEPRTPGELKKLAGEQAEVLAQKSTDEPPTEAEVLKGLTEAHEALAKIYESRGDIDNAERVRGAAKTFAGTAGSTAKPKPESRTDGSSTPAKSAASPGTPAVATSTPATGQGTKPSGSKL